MISCNNSLGVVPVTVDYNSTDRKKQYDPKVHTHEPNTGWDPTSISKRPVGSNGNIATMAMQQRTKVGNNDSLLIRFSFTRKAMLNVSREDHYIWYLQ